MDLDSIKKEWKENNVQSTIDEEKIEIMINNSGQSAFQKILKYEKISTVALIVCFLLVKFIFRYELLQWVYGISAVVILVWQTYKLLYLRKIDMLHMSITEISRFYIRYRKFMIYETVISMCWFLAFVGLFGYLEFVNNPDFMAWKIKVFCIVFGTTFIVCLWLVWKLMWKNLKQLGNSIREVKEMEKNNQ